MKRIIFTLAIVAISAAIYAQPLNPNNPVPLDGGLSVLLAAGAAYGASRLYHNQKKKKAERL